MDKTNIKDERITIHAIENGFSLSFAYRLKPTDSKQDYWDYKTKEYAFNDWNAVVKWVTENPVTQPPQ